MTIPTFSQVGTVNGLRLGAVPSRMHCGEGRRLDHYTVISSGLHKGRERITTSTQSLARG
jgi:hypothetical protein